MESPPKRIEKNSGGSVAWRSRRVALVWIHANVLSTASVLYKNYKAARLVWIFRLVYMCSKASVLCLAPSNWRKRIQSECTLAFTRDIKYDYRNTKNTHAFLHNYTHIKTHMGTIRALLVVDGVTFLHVPLRQLSGACEHA